MSRDSVRFWIPVVLLYAAAAYFAGRVCERHLAPKVKDLDYTVKLTLPEERGTIYDRFGEAYPLAMSVPFWEYRLDPVALTNRTVKARGEKTGRTREQIVATIADALSLNRRSVEKMALNTANKFQYLATTDSLEAHAVMTNSARVGGVIIRERQIRQYLHGRLMSHVLGSVNKAGVGTSGVELKMHREISGVPGRAVYLKDARQNILYDRLIERVDPIRGSDVVLTLDHNLQNETEKALKAGIEQFGAGSGWAIVMDVATGEILAMASAPDFEPLRFGSASEAAQLNRAIGYNYEPGSVMKVITAASAFDAGIARPWTRYRTNRDDDRYYRLPGDGRHVWDEYMTISNAIVHSSNIVIGKLGVDLSPLRLHEYMKKFGLGIKTGIELVGEERGNIPHWKKWDKVKWSRAPIGQGVQVTAIQLAGAYQAIANDGMRMKPHLISKIVGPDGTPTYVAEPVCVDRPIGREAARMVREAMRGVATRDGTARRAAIPGYSIAGKTGTAQKVINGTYSDVLFDSTFCGIIPAGEPRLVILVTLDFDEKRPLHQGGNTSAVIFKSIAEYAMSYLMVPPDKPEELADRMYDEP